MQAYLKQGQLKDAIRWQRRAIAFETPWNREAGKRNNEYLHELLAMLVERDRETAAATTPVVADSPNISLVTNTTITSCDTANGEVSK